MVTSREAVFAFPVADERAGPWPVAALRAHRPREAEFIMDRFDRRVPLNSATISYVDPSRAGV